MKTFLFIFLIFSPTCLAETQNTCVNYYDSYSYTYATSNTSELYLSSDIIDCSGKCDNNTLCGGFNYNFENNSLNCQILFDIIDIFYSPNCIFYQRSKWTCDSSETFTMLMLFVVIFLFMLTCYFTTPCKNRYNQRHAGYQSIQ